MKKVYSICEYEYFTRDVEVEDSKFYLLPERVFDFLLESILSESLNGDNLQDFFEIVQKRNIGTVIQARNYVGSLLLKNGVSIQILPKIIENHDLHREGCKIFLQMLKAVWNLPLKKVQEASLMDEKSGIFEWFIQIFLRETEMLVKQGLNSDYQLVESNEVFLKGKLLLSKHITHNMAHKEYFYVEKDMFCEDRPENRLIKSALLEVNKIANLENKIKIRKLLSYFYSVPSSAYVKKDFSCCKKDRNNKKYDSVIEWCQVFLNQRKFSTFYGNRRFLSLFFQMNQLFEEYIAKQIYQTFHSDNCVVKTQLRGNYLMEAWGENDILKKQFELIPDIVIWHNNEPTILDTKWKLLNTNKKNYGISQEDIYQMFAYGTRFQSKKVIMLYPKREIMQKTIVFSLQNNIIIKVIWVDLFHIEETLEDIRKELE